MVMIRNGKGKVLRLVAWNVRGVNKGVKERKIMQVTKDARLYNIWGMAEAKIKFVKECKYGLKLCAGVNRN